MKRILYLIPLALILTACKPATVQPGQVAPTFYSQAATAMNGFSGVLNSAQGLFQTACTEKLIDSGSCKDGENVFIQVAQSADGIVTSLQAAVPQATVEAQINALIKQIGSMPQSFAIKNPQSQAAFSSLVNSLVSILQATETSVTAATN